MEGLSSINYNSRTASLQRKISFKGNPEQAIPPQEKENGNKNTKILLGLAALAAGGIAIAIMAKKGKLGKAQGVTETATKNTETVTHETKKAVEKATDTVKEVLSLEEFRAQGKFQKGRAILNDGTNYSGKINTGKHILQYTNGRLFESLNQNLSPFKRYQWEDGRIVDVVKDGKRVVLKSLYSTREFDAAEFSKKYGTIKGLRGTWKNGDNFTGTLTKQLKSGERIEMTYDGGYLQESTKYLDDKQIWLKSYGYSSKGNHVSVFDENDNFVKLLRRFSNGTTHIVEPSTMVDGKKMFTTTVIDPKGNIITKGLKTSMGSEVLS